MKIVHICLACFYIDGMAYQENILPKYHSYDHDIYIITSDFSFDSSGKKTQKDKKEYCNEYNIPVKVLDRCKGRCSRYGGFEKLYSTLCDIRPDVIFCHGGQFVSLKDVIQYCKKNRGVKLFIDQHGDYYNTPVNTIKKRLGQYLIYGHWMRKAYRYVDKYWGVTPWRCQYLNDVYGISKKKIGFLPMGGDDEKIRFSEKELIKERIRSENNIAPTDFLIITGGKIDAAKNIHHLMKAIADLDRDDVKLLMFGQANDTMKAEIEGLAEDSHIRHIGWIPSDTVYDYFLASDLAVFPGTHSVLWEQACACGLPGLYRDWAGMHHVDVGGNVVFLKEGNFEEIREIISELLNNRDKLKDMKEVAVNKGIPVFSYREISKRAIFEDK